ncbi:ADA HAT complex component 1 [Exophiala viscosa]|uniref:ADA HAT complex component 1 n=1 Tax=Exophiala viscosa TaxID=2486360 RepID=A0AAN6E1T2_9EURO|nr:ADA HAT complex component 1 [Exophiala viscosa]KAI1629814.1 ADA HAT complex component 1 [Exophiala viscosa]
MLRLLSWTGCDKASTPEMRMFVSNQESPGSGATAMSSPRKRKHSAEPSSQPDKKRAKPAERKSGKPALATVTPPRASPAELPVLKPSTITTEPPSSQPLQPDVKLEECEAGPKPTENDSLLTGAGAQRLQSVRNVIQTQIGLEILLKHKELRLIDQEIAKCQASLEQLRRCKEIPYPGTQHLSAAVSEGTGSALRSAFPTPLPQSPAPWAVTDGPYSRHYAKWLLPDTRFDGGEPDSLSAVSAGKSPLKSRSTRGSFEMPSVSTSARSSRGGKLKALPAGYGQPKEKATGPMIVKRKSDGLSVKLVCPDCGRHDFGSAQGFINHCRIGHGRSFASHDAAADACGEPVEIDESGAVVGAEPVATPTAVNVHPLIRSAKLLQPTPPRTSAQLSGTSANDGPSVSKSKLVSPDFKGSVLTPNLSDLVKNRGLGLDLQEMVADAKTKVELPDSDSEDDDMDVDVPMQDTAKGRHPQVAGTKQPSKSSKSPMSSPILSSHTLRSSAIPRRGLPQYDGADDTPIHDRPRGMTLPMTQPTVTDLQPSDPSPTSESNQAPSLVDDDEEYEAHSPTSSSVSDEHDVGEVEFEVQGDEDDARSIVLRGPEFQPSCAQATRPSTHVRRPSAIRRQGEDREEKHVSFVSPSPAREMQTSRQGGDRKKRKA